MSGLIENFIRRIEKIVPERATVPAVGTNHVDDTWIETDIYPAELAIRLENGSLYTSDGRAIIDLNKENMILSGLVVSKDTSGVNKLTVSSGHVRINGIHYYHASATGSGTDILLPYNTGTCSALYFIYAQTSNAVAVGHPGASGDLRATLGYVSQAGYVTEPGLFSDIALSAGVPPIPSDSILLGTVLVPVGSTGYELWPRSVANTGDYYPKFSVTPSEFLRQSIYDVSHYQVHSLYFPGEFVIDDTSNTIYLSKKIFVSDYASIAGDITVGNLIALGGSGGGASGSMTVSNLGTGATVFAQIVGSDIQLRSILGTAPVQVTYGTDEITVSLDTSTILMGVTNLGAGSQVYRDTVANIVRLRTLVAGSNVAIVQGTNNITISVPEIGTTAMGINLGTGITVYAGMSGKDLTFKTLGFTGGLTASITANEILVSGANLAEQGVNLDGPIQIYAGMTGQNLAFYGLSAGDNVTLSQVGNQIVISASGGSGGAGSQGINLGTSTPVYVGMSGSDLTFYTIAAGPGITIGISGGSEIVITANILDGTQGPQGFQGASGTDGTNGVDGVQGPQGLQGNTGADSTVQGPQGFQGYGYQGPQGHIGFQGLQGPQGTPIDARFVDVWDNTGGHGITAIGSPTLINFGATRVNTDPTLYTIGATAITINESGYYQFIYNLSYSVIAGDSVKFYLFEETAGRIDGSDIWIAPTSGRTTVYTVTGKVGMTCTGGESYSVVGELGIGSVGPATSYVDASSFMITKLEVGIGPQGPAIEGPQGAAGAQGGAGPTGDALVVTLVPLTGNGASATPVQMMYSSDFILNGLQQLYLNLDFTTLVTPTLQRNWWIYKNDGITPFPTASISGISVGPTLTSSSITVPSGCKVSYGGTATIPATGAGESFPTAATGSWSIGLTGPTTSYITASGVSSDTSYSIQITKPMEGLGITGSISNMATWRVQRVSGTDSKSASDSVTFTTLFYWGTCGTLGTGNISQATADTISVLDVQSLLNYRFGTKSQTFTGVTDSVGTRLVIAYPASYGDLSSIILDGAAPILGAFYKRASDVTITTIAGSSVTYRVYVAIADNSYSGNQITTS